MKLFLFCIFIAVLGLARGVDIKCVIYNDTICRIAEPVTIERGEKVNIVSDVNLNSINRIVFVAEADNRSEISTVPNQIFDQLPNLETLELYATVKELNKGDFEKAGKLERLTIENQLKIIPAGVLGSAKNLDRLILSNNQIAQIEDNAFSGLNALFSLYLANNNLTIIKQNTFNGLEKLGDLVLDSNQIESIEENALNLPNLKLLFMTDNKLTNLPDYLFSAIPQLELFFVQRNEIKHIGNALYGLKNLNSLSLSENELTDVDLVAFSQMPVLEYLFLRKIGFTSENISKIEIEEPSKSVLSYLSLADNKLANNDDWKKFIIFPQLKTINVGNTKYSKIDLGNKTLRQKFPKLERVLVTSGEWNCDWLKNFIESSRADGIDVRTIASFDTNGKNDIGCV